MNVFVWSAMAEKYNSSGQSIHILQLNSLLVSLFIRCGNENIFTSIQEWKKRLHFIVFRFFCQIFLCCYLFHYGKGFTWFILRWQFDGNVRCGGVLILCGNFDFSLIRFKQKMERKESYYRWQLHFHKRILIGKMKSYSFGVPFISVGWPGSTGTQISFRKTSVFALHGTFFLEFDKHKKDDALYEAVLGTFRGLREMLLFNQKYNWNIRQFMKIFRIWKSFS